MVPIRWVLIRDPLKPDAPAQALLCTDLGRTPEEIVTWFVRRWRVETTFEEVRTHLGVKTQRQWSDRAIARTTPCLLALFSIVTLLARTLPARQRRDGGCMVPQSPPDLLRRPLGSASRDLARTAFPNVSAANRQTENPLQAAAGLGLRPLQRSLKRPKSSGESVR